MKHQVAMSPKRCEEILLTTDGLGKGQKALALYYLLAYEPSRMSELVPEHTKIEIAGYKAQIERLKRKLEKPETSKPVIPVKKSAKVAACFYCGEVVEGVTTDHFIPASLGGGKGMNSVASCSPCNGSKGNRLPSPSEIRKYFAMWKSLGIDLSQFIENKNGR